jgi:hypothetical protein
MEKPIHQMALLGGFLKQMNDTIAYNRRLLNKKFTVEKLREAYREEVTSRPLQYARLNPDLLKERIRKKLKRNRLQEWASRVMAIIFLGIVLTGAVWMVMLLTAFSAIRVQIPQDIPHQSEPVDFSDPLNLVLYIVLPALMILVYVLWRRSKRNQ